MKKLVKGKNMKKVKEIFKKFPFVLFFKNMIDDSKKFFKYLLASYKLKNKKVTLNILSNEQTIKKVKENRMSIVRYGDGEFMYISCNAPITYQKFDGELRKKLLNILNVRDDRLLICLPEPLNTLSNLVKTSKWYWKYRIYKDFEYYSKLDMNYEYGNSFISRPYIVYKDKSNKRNFFKLLKSIWENKDVIIIEGKHSCSGVGNDLFSKAKSLRRIICPDRDAYSFYDDIINYIQNNIVNSSNLLFLIALGPTAKPLVYDLVNIGFWAIDIGHIDSEYEWFLMNAKRKVKLSNKHTAEVGNNYCGDCNDKRYIESIIAKIGDE